MGRAIDAFVVDGHDLIAATQPPVVGGRAFLEDVLDVDREVAVRTATSPDDTESQAFRSALETDFFESATLAADDGKVNVRTLREV